MKHIYYLLRNLEENEREIETTSGLEQERDFPKCEDTHPDEHNTALSKVGHPMDSKFPEYNWEAGANAKPQGPTISMV